MSHHTKLEGADNFRAWKYRISLVLEENELDTYIKEEVPIPVREEAKALHKKNLVKDKRIIVDSIKDHLITQVSSLKTPKEMFDSLTKLVEKCEDPECRDHTVMLYKGLSNKRKT